MYHDSERAGVAAVDAAASAAHLQQVAIQASCSASARAGETMEGGIFTSKWALHPCHFSLTHGVLPPDPLYAHAAIPFLVYDCNILRMYPPINTRQAPCCYAPLLWRSRDPAIDDAEEKSAGVMFVPGMYLFKQRAFEGDTGLKPVVVNKY